MPTVIPDTHPLKPGYYFIDIQKDHVTAHRDGELVGITDGSGKILERIFLFSLSGTGYSILHFASKQYVWATATEGSLVHLWNNPNPPTVWNIQKDGEGIYRIAIPEKDLYWTETVVWGARLFKLYGSDGKKDQMFTFKPLDENKLL